MDEKQVLMMHATREMMVEFMRNNGRLESRSAEGNATVGGSPRGAEPTAARKTSAAAAAGSRAQGIAVPVDVGPARCQPDQQWGAKEWDTYPGGELGEPTRG